MIKYILLICSVFLFLNGSGQKCNYEKNEIDGLLEVPIKRTAAEIFCRIDNQPFYAKAQCIGSNKYLKIIYYKHNDFAIQDDREVAFILPSNDKITLYPREMSVDTSSMSDVIDMTTLLVYKLSTDQYETLKNIPVIEFKYFVVGGFVEEEIKPSKQKVIMELLRCVE